MATHRDRATGWQHAKRTGHENEAILEELMLHDIETHQYFLDRVGKPNASIVSIDIGGKTPGSYEAGTTCNPSITSTFTPIFPSFNCVFVYSSS